MIAQVEAILKATEAAAGQDFRYWFVGASVILLFFAYFVLKLVLKQLSDQREATVQQQKEKEITVNKLIDYISNDHIKMVAVLTDVGQAVKNFANTMENYFKK